MVSLEIAPIASTIGSAPFVVQPTRGRGTRGDVMLGVLPFVNTMFALTGMWMNFPQLT